MPMGSLLPRLPYAIAGALALVGGIWLAAPASTHGLSPRLPGADRVGTADVAAPEGANLEGMFAAGSGKASQLAGAWPGFRGIGRDNISGERVDPMLWPPQGPRKVWEVAAGEGYASPAIADGRAYLLDYEVALRSDVLRCLSLDDGQEIWRRAYKSDVKRNHGMSRTVPAVADGFVVTLGPKCHVVCTDAKTGEYVWGIDMVREYGAKVPPWYAGQCPLIDQGRVILAPAGDSLLVAVELSSGKVAWTTPNPQGWTQTHTSVVPMRQAGRRTYVYAGSGGVAGVDAQTGAMLWSTGEWKVKIAAVPSPVVVGDDRLLLSGGYDAGAAMLQLSGSGPVEAKVLWKCEPAVFGAEQQTPIYHRDKVFGVIPGGQLVCLGLNGKQQWNSGADRFGIGPYMIAGDVLLLMNDKGTLSAVELGTERYRPIGSWLIFDKGHEAWGPMALIPGRLLVRDFTRLACLDIGGS